MARRSLWKVLVPTLAAGLAVVGYVGYRALRLPASRPARFLNRARPDGPVVVCIGDSLTHGTVSANYVDMLEQRFGPRGFHFVNAGVNSELAYNVGRRLEPIIDCRPDYVTVLIGTNDVNATMSDSNLRRYIKQMRLPTTPTRAWYEENLTRIVRELKAQTGARIALISPPVLGEGLEEPSNAKIREYAAVAREVARREGVSYLPLYERQAELLEQTGHTPRYRYQTGLGKVLAATFQHFLLRRGLDDLSSRNGYLLLTEGIHLNSRGAGMIAELIADFLENPAQVELPPAA